MISPIVSSKCATAASGGERFCQSCGCEIASPKTVPPTQVVPASDQDNGECASQASTRHIVYAIIVVCVLVGYVVHEGERTRDTLRALDDLTGTKTLAVEPDRASPWSGGYSEGRFMGNIDRNKASNKYAPSSLNEKDRTYFMAAYPVSRGTKDYGDFWSGYERGYYGARK
jgi:hypothetical protein